MQSKSKFFNKQISFQKITSNYSLDKILDKK
jgi:hypothetical protein